MENLEAHPILHRSRVRATAGSGRASVKVFGNVVKLDKLWACGSPGSAGVNWAPGDRRVRRFA